MYFDSHLKFVPYIFKIEMNVYLNIHFIIVGDVTMTPLFVLF